MSQEDILQPIQIAMNNYKELATTPITEDNTIQDLQHRLNNLSTSETRNYFQSLFIPHQNQQPAITNELEIYFNSNPPGLEILPLEW